MQNLLYKDLSTVGCNKIQIKVDPVWGGGDLSSGPMASPNEGFKEDIYTNEAKWDTL